MVRFDMGTGAVCGNMPAYEGVNVQFSPRRTLLDHVLVEAAREAGAEVREDFIVEELLTEAGQVVGIRGRHKGGAVVTERARLVVGADGKNSTVAKAVNAPSYWEQEPQTMGYYTYWADVEIDEGIASGFGRAGCAVGAVPTNDKMMMVYVAWPVARFEEFRRDVEGNYMRTVDSVGLGERLRAGQRAERFRGSPDFPGFFRKPYGPGWALVGDAGLVMDPITGQGVGDAFRDAELLTDAVAAGFDGTTSLSTALADYQETRDQVAKPMYDFTAEQAKLAEPTAEQLALFEGLAANQRDADRFIAVINGVLPVAEFMAQPLSA
jgi:flavin-dependent dehydrogenase